MPSPDTVPCSTEKSPWPSGSTSPSVALPLGIWITPQGNEISMKGAIQWAQAVNLGLHNPSTSLATHLIRGKSNTKTKNSPLYKHWEATAGPWRLKERERAPPLS